MFLDEKQLRIKAGKGGDGAVLFRREIYVPRGGPDGGDGGKGGDVVIVVKRNLHALTHLAHVDSIKAEDGQKGGHRTSTGKSGQETEIHLPLGTIIEVHKDEAWVTLAEAVEEGQRIVVAKGGNGGWGNWRFKSSVTQTPDRANPGLPGESIELRFTLKLIADMGLVGLPNAGKSTFLSVVSAARPKIANYPFTTLEPQLGVAHAGTGDDARPLVIADLPGLIEGASGGKGLGIAFLKHIERTKAILHCIAIDASVEELEQNYNTIRSELIAWSPDLAAKKEIIMLTKSELVTSEDAEVRRSTLQKLSGNATYLISAATHTGLQEVLTACLNLL